ncbi:MAG: HD domain-containing protein [Planctomycetota bacterium]
MAYGERFEEALQLAARLHRLQVRKSTGIPYITHLLAVAAMVGEEGGTEDEVIAALLHDAVEDQGGRATLEVIRERFGETVAAIVHASSDAEVTPKPPWRQRKEAYLAHLAEASPSVRLISCADKLHNARSILADLDELGESLWSRFNGGKEGTLWYYRAVVETLRTHGAPRRLLRELEAAVEQMERRARPPASC